MKAAKKGSKVTGVTEAEAAAGLSALFGDQTAEERAIERIEKELAVVKRGVGTLLEGMTVLLKSDLRNKDAELLARKKQLSTKKQK